MDGQMVAFITGDGGVGSSWRHGGGFWNCCCCFSVVLYLGVYENTSTTGVGLMG
jgi:hypothetical protein